jgi:hypothetical protein
MTQRSTVALVGVGILIVIGLVVAAQSPLSHGVDPTPSSSHIVTHQAVAVVYDPSCGNTGRPINPLGGPVIREECTKYDDMLDATRRKEIALSGTIDEDEQYYVNVGSLTADEKEANRQKRIAAGYYKRWDAWSALYNRDCTYASCYAVDKLIEWQKMYPDSNAH